MTTRIIIVNEGPGNIVVELPNSPGYFIDKGQHHAELVYDGREIHIKEAKEIIEKKPA